MTKYIKSLVVLPNDDILSYKEAPEAKAAPNSSVILRNQRGLARLRLLGHALSGSARKIDRVDEDDGASFTADRPIECE